MTCISTNHHTHECVDTQLQRQLIASPSQHNFLRPLQHRQLLTPPRNHRIDVTECARKLLAAGARELQITLIVIGADYEEDVDLLKLEGVSLNFLD